MFSEFAGWLKAIIEQLASWVIEIFLQVCVWFWSALLDLLDAFGLADQIRDTAALFDNIPDSVWYFMNFGQVQYGLGVTLVAYVIRFAIRRLPIVG